MEINPVVNIKGENISLKNDRLIGVTGYYKYSYDHHANVRVQENGELSNKKLKIERARITIKENDEIIETFSMPQKYLGFFIEHSTGYYIQAHSVNKILSKDDDGNIIKEEYVSLNKKNQFLVKAKLSGKQIAQLTQNTRFHGQSAGNTIFFDSLNNGYGMDGSKKDINNNVNNIENMIIEEVGYQDPQADNIDNINNLTEPVKPGKLQKIFSFCKAAIINRYTMIGLATITALYAWYQKQTITFFLSKLIHL